MISLIDGRRQDATRVTIFFQERYLQLKYGIGLKIGAGLKKFFMDLFARHSWIIAGSQRHCATCGRHDIEQYEQNDFSKVLDWNCVEAGDVRKHWQ
jgi:hypothetical protein